jgi:hypothetical protein
MNVAVSVPASPLPAPDHSIAAQSDPAAYQNEWIDPEGNDWFSAVYAELTGASPVGSASESAAESQHWFG